MKVDKSGRLGTLANFPPGVPRSFIRTDGAAFSLLVGQDPRARWKLKLYEGTEGEWVERLTVPRQLLRHAAVNFCVTLDDRLHVLLVDPTNRDWYVLSTDIPATSSNSKVFKPTVERLTRGSANQSTNYSLSRSFAGPQHNPIVIAFGSDGESHFLEVVRRVQPAN